MRAVIIMAVLLGSSTAFGQIRELTVRTCEDAQIDLRSVMRPVHQNVRDYFKDEVAVFGIDQMEPVCCAAGVAVVLPDVENPLGGMSQCFAVIGLAAVNVRGAKTLKTAKKGLLLAIPTHIYSQQHGPVQGPLLKLLIDPTAGTVTIER